MSSKKKPKQKYQPKTPNPNREFLKQLSNMLHEYVAEGVYSCVNDAIIDVCYRKDGHEVFNTFHQWLKLGKCVRKGEKAFIVWSSPMRAKAKKAEGSEEADEYKLFGLCYLFSNLQVDDLPPK